MRQQSLLKGVLVVVIIALAGFIAYNYITSYLVSSNNVEVPEEMPVEFEKEFRIAIYTKNKYVEDALLAVSHSKNPNKTLEFETLKFKEGAFRSENTFTFTLKFENESYWFIDEDNRYFFVRFRESDSIKEYPGMQIDTYLHHNNYVNVYFSRDPWIELTFSDSDDLTGLFIRTEYEKR